MFTQRQMSHLANILVLLKLSEVLLSQGITFEKARRATNRSLKMTIWSLGSDLCYEEKNIRQGAPL